MAEYDLAAAEREGLTPVLCPKCGSVLGMEERDGKTVRVNGNASVTPTRGRVGLRCSSCQYLKDWRPSEKPA